MVSRTATVRPLRAAAAMTMRQKMALGAVGAVTPLALNLLVVDQLALGNLTILAFIGYAIRVAVLVGLGSLVVYLNNDEDNRTRIFQLGLAAPALVTALLNGANQRSLLQTQQFVTPRSAAIFSTVVHAEEAAPQGKQFTIPKETQAQQVWRGLTGHRSDRVWFVIAAQELTYEAAAKRAGQINRTFKGFHAEVYEPYQQGGRWCVVIGAALTRADAMNLRRSAVDAGLTDADLWTPPETRAEKKGAS